MKHIFRIFRFDSLIGLQITSGFQIIIKSQIYCYNEKY